MPGEVFVSYSHTDSEYVRQLAQFLRSNGFTVWTDEGIDIGTQWISVVRGKVDTCAAFVPVMTAKAEESTWVARELERADAFNRPVLPLLLEGAPLGSIGGVQYEDVRGGRMPSRRFLDRLAAVVSGSGYRRDEFDVILESCGPKKIQVIAVIRELINLGLKETKDLVEAAPQPVLQRVGKERAERAKGRLEALGAVVSLK